MEHALPKSGAGSKALLWSAMLAIPLLLIAATGGLYFLLLTLLILLSLFYVATSGPLKLARFFDLPVYFTAFVLLNFGFAPLEAFWDPDNMMVDLHGDLRTLTTALGLVLVGMI